MTLERKELLTAALAGHEHQVGVIEEKMREISNELMDVDYLVTKLGITPLLKQRKRDHEYLAKIVRVIKMKILSEVPSE